MTARPTPTISRTGTDRLAGKVAVVTGATSGIGLAAATAFVAEGAAVGLVDLSVRTVARLKRKLGGAAFGLPADVSDEGSVREAFAHVQRTAGQLDVLFNSAAVQLNGRDSRAHELDLEVWRLTLAVNLTGTFLCCKHAIPLMLATGGGSIVICGSPTGIRGAATGFDAYSASKGGVMAFSRVLAMDYVSDGIRVNTLVPGTTDTPLIHMNIADVTKRRQIEAAIPLGRLANPSEYASLAVYLASDESSYATGAEFIVDGGVTAR